MKSEDGVAIGQSRRESYGQRGLTPIDRYGVMLSRRPILHVVRQYHQPMVLDIGCGYEAALLRDLLPLLGTGVGVDVSVSAEAKAEPRLQFFEQPIEEAIGHLSARRFDVILLISVLEHLWHPAEILAACQRLLLPKGSLVINVPNWRGKEFLEFSAFKLGWSPAVEMDDHKLYYDKRDLWPLLVGAGFRPSNLRLRYHKFGLNLFAVATNV